MAWTTENPANSMAIIEEKKYGPQRKRRMPPMALIKITSPASHMAPPRTGKHRQQLLHHIVVVEDPLKRWFFVLAYVREIGLEMRLPGVGSETLKRSCS